MIIKATAIRRKRAKNERFIYIMLSGHFVIVNNCVIFHNDEKNTAMKTPDTFLKYEVVGLCNNIINNESIAIHYVPITESVVGVCSITLDAL